MANNKLRDMIHVGLALAEYTKIPCLFISNPGLGKTTSIRSWCEKRDYRLTTLIGSQRTSEEILGYMVNNGKELITYPPDWYNEIIKANKEGHKTVLFIDELSTAPENVQGSMLQLIFDRKVGGNNYLPESTMIVSAANYKGNLPPQNSILAPALNRFCIINLEPESNTSLIEEFLQSSEDMEHDPIKFGSNNITPKVEDKLRLNMKEILSNLVVSFSKNNNIDFKNQEYNDLYESSEGKIYNFISGRTVHYLYRMFLGIIHLNLVWVRTQEFIDNIILGLIGAGTKSFKETSEYEDWVTAVKNASHKIMRLTIDQSGISESVNTNINFDGETLSDNINIWMNYAESKSQIFDHNLEKICKLITQTYPTDADGMAEAVSKIQSQKDGQLFLNDFLKIQSLIQIIKPLEVQQIESLVKEIEIVESSYTGYVAQVLASVATNKRS